MTGVARLLVIVVLLASGVISSFDVPARQVTAQWQVRAVVQNPRLTPNSMMLSHQAIDGLLPAMTRPFQIESSALAQGVGYDDQVEVTFSRQGERFVIHQITVLASATRATQTTGAQGNGRAVVPWDQPLISRQGLHSNLRTHQNKTIVVSFVYTRCRTVCPAHIARLKQLYSKLSPQQLDQVQFVTITIDPEHDQPAQLRRFATAFGIEGSNWEFYTGNTTTIKRVTNSFNAVATRSGNAVDFDHSNNVYVVSRYREPISVYDGNSATLVSDVIRDLATDSTPSL